MARNLGARQSAIPAAPASWDSRIPPLRQWPRVRRTSDAGLAGQGPVDCVAYNEQGQLLLLDSMQDAKRVNPGRMVAIRVHRKLSPLQKQLGVRTAYIDLDTRDVHVVPPIDET